MTEPVFDGFEQNTLDFLRDLAAHNDRDWFEAHRDIYQLAYVQPALAFVGHMGQRLRTISPGVQFTPKINGSLMRINRDVRFSKDKSPYKAHLDVWFWHGERKAWASPGFFMRITPDRAYLGTGMHVFDKGWMEAFRQAVVGEKSGPALLKAVAKIEKSGAYTIGGSGRKRVPAGYDADHPRANYLLHDGLQASIELPAEAIVQPGFCDAAFSHFKATWPVSNWLLEYGQPGGQRQSDH